MNKGPRAWLSKPGPFACPPRQRSCRHKCIARGVAFVTFSGREGR